MPLSRWVLIQGRRQFEPLLLPTYAATPRQILQWFRQRWQVRSLREARSHLGVETQRQWSSDWSAPHLFLLGLFTIVTTRISNWHRRFRRPCRSSGITGQPTFADALALVRQQPWQMRTFQMSTSASDLLLLPVTFFNTWSDSLLCC